MLENYITQVRRPKGVSSEREAFVSRAAQASAAACILKKFGTMLEGPIVVKFLPVVSDTHDQINEKD